MRPFRVNGFPKLHCAFLLLAVYCMAVCCESTTAETNFAPSSSTETHNPITVANVSSASYATRRVPFPSRREDIGRFLETMGLKTGAEIGVQRGNLSFRIMMDWPSCQQFMLVDPWKTFEPNDNYKDMANVPQWQQDMILESVLNIFLHFHDKTKIYRTTSLQIAPNVLNKTLDFVYLDARHDYCAVKQDLEAWWPKIREGGIFSGHDFIDTRDPRGNLEDWEWCEDGRREPGGVKRAVEEFAQLYNLSIATTTLDAPFVSWFIQKPFETI